MEKGGDIDFSITLTHLDTSQEFLDKQINNKLDVSEYYYNAIIRNLEELSSSKSSDVKEKAKKLKTTFEEKIKIEK